MTGRALSRSRANAVALAALAAASAAFVALFFAYPVLTVVVRGVGGVAGVLADPVHRGVVWFTFWQAAVSTLLTLAVGLPAAALVARLRPRARRLLRAGVTVGFVLPTVVVAGAFEAVFARLGLRDGPVSLHHSVWAILLAHVFFNYAVVVRTVGSWWAGIDRRAGDAAASLGATPTQVLAHVTWPMLRPAVLTAGAITFLFSFTSFGVILILGGPARATLETEIYRYAITRIDFDTAAALAAVQLAAVVALVVTANRTQRRQALVRRPAGLAAPVPGRRLAAVNAVVMATLLGLPAAVLVEQSLRSGDGYSFANFAALAHRVTLLPTSALGALGNSFVFAAVATALATAVGVAASLVVVRGRRAVASAFDLALTLPLGTSAVTVGMGMLLTLGRLPFDLRTSRWIVPIAHALVGMPFVVRTLVPTLRSVDDRLRAAAAVLGASPRRVWREVDMPIASRAVAVGAAFAAAVSLGEFGATAFLPRRPDTLTAPLALYRLLGTPGEALRGQAMALAVVLMAATALAVVVIEGMRRTDEGVF